MLQVVTQNYGTKSTLGNDGGVRTWLGDIVDLPSHQGRATAVFMNSVFGNLHDPKAALTKCVTSLLLPNGYIVISHPQGVPLSHCFCILVTASGIASDRIDQSFEAEGFESKNFGWKTIWSIKTL